jgi:hypothetical protein
MLKQIYVDMPVCNLSKDLSEHPQPPFRP